MNPLPESALMFAEVGCRVVPVRGKNLAPLLGRGWERKAGRAPDNLRRWWREWPDANVGVVGGRAVVPIDIDDPASFAAFQQKFGQAPATWRSLTGGAPGRERLWFAHPGDNSLEQFGSSRKLASGVQIRDERRESVLMSLAPPSIHPETSVVTEWRVAPGEVPLAPLPPEWLKALEPQRTENGKPIGRPLDHWTKLISSDIHEKAETGGDIGRHDRLLEIAGYLMRRLGSARLTAELMLGWNLRHCKPPKDEREVLAIAAYVARKEAAR
jgi:Bifunctional DNA primase/polymerase, N-terminal